MLRKRISVSAVRKFAVTALSALTMVVLCVSCSKAEGEYLGKAGSKGRCENMADKAGCKRDGTGDIYTWDSGTHDCFCRDW